MKKVLLLCVLLFCFVLLLLFFVPLSHAPQQPIAKTPAADAALVHAYWFSQKDNGKLTLSLRSYLAVEAAATLYQQKKVRYIVVAGGPIWGPDYPALSVAMEKQLRLLGIPKTAIIRQETAMDTYDEVALFLQDAQKYHWRTLLDLAAAVQDITIPTIYNNQHHSAAYVTLENVLQTYGTANQKQNVHTLASSAYEANMRLYENLIRIALFFDPHYTLLGKEANATRHRKMGYGVPFFPADVYNL